MTTPAPVTRERIKIAKDHHIVHAEGAAQACRTAGLPFYVALALLQMESPDKSRIILGGANIYGHDSGGYFYGHGVVTKKNYEVFRHNVVDLHHTSNGVGPCQITYPVYFPQMEAQGLRPWVPHDNMVFGFGIMAGNYRSVGNWTDAGARYNGGPNPNSQARDYGHLFDIFVADWKRRLKI